MRWPRWFASILLITALLWMQPARPGAALFMPPSVNLLAIYVLAFDNRPDSSLDLTPQYATTLDGLATATAGQPDRLAIVLADLHGQGDTHIRLVYNGQVSSVLGLPDASGVLSPTLTEYDTTDGATLGGFLIWATQQVQASRRIFSYIGHGTPLVPDTDIANIFSSGVPRISTLPPLPTNIGANPDLTDMHMPPGSAAQMGMLSPYGLSEALSQVASNHPFELIDLLMCFAMSIEETSELAPYAQVLVGSPNYAFFDPRSPGLVLAALDPAQSAAAMGATAVTTYDPILPASAHPRILVAVSGARIAAIKSAWDTTAAAIYARLLLPGERVATRQRLLAAYQASHKYDLSFCSAQWELGPPDGLVDLYHFAVQIRQQFFDVPEIVAGASATELSIIDPGQGAILTRRAHNDVPWFDPSVAPWEFDGPSSTTHEDDAAGLSMYADLQGLPQAGGSIALSWHAHWYDDTVSSANPHPYQFVQDGSTIGWDEVFQEYWAGANLTTAACSGRYPVARVTDLQNDIRVEALRQPSGKQVSVGAPVALSAAVRASAYLPSVQLRFEIVQQGSVVFSDTVSSDALLPGMQSVAAFRAWTPAQTGPFTLRVTADLDNRILEENEANNVRQFTGNVISAQLPVLSGDLLGSQWLLRTSAITVNLAQVNLNQPAVQRIVAQVYQFKEQPGSPLWAPVLRGTVVRPAGLPGQITLELPAGVTPGALLIHIWGDSSVGRSVAPVVIRSNVAPFNTRLKGTEAQLYSFDLERSDGLALTLTAHAGNSDLRGWEPYVLGLPTQVSALPGSDSLELTAPIQGAYRVLISGDPNAVFTLQGTLDGMPLRRSAGPQPNGTADMRAPLLLKPQASQLWSMFIPLATR